MYCLSKATKTSRSRAPIAGLMLLAAASAQAHHSATMFDSSKTITMEGTVTEFQYTNPHSWLRVLVSQPDGKAVEWGFESEGPSSLLREGIKSQTFSAGDKVKVTAYPMRDGRPAGLLLSVSKPGGPAFVVMAPSPSAKSENKSDK